MRKNIDVTILVIGLPVMMVVIAISCARPAVQLYYYNAYSPLYNEYFVVSSSQELKAKDVIWFDDNAQAVDYATPYVATILSPYKQ